MIKLLVQTVRNNPKYFITLIGGLILISLASFYIINNSFLKTKKQSLDDRINQAEDARRFDNSKIDPVMILSDLYLQKVRETADISYYTKIDTLLDSLNEDLKNHYLVYYIKAQVENGRHNFVEAEKLARESIKIQPNSAKLYGALFDSLNEQGKYKEAEQTLQKMINIRPDFSSLTRVAYFREINGDIAGAHKALDEAMTAGAPFAENRAWLFVEIGKLYFKYDNDIEKSTANFNDAMQTIKDYPPALEWLANIELKKGNNKKAREYAEKALEILPIAQYSTLLAEIVDKEGDAQTTAQMLTITQITYEASEKSGMNTDMELAYFLADHDLRLEEALQKALKSYETRKSIYGADVLAWAYYKNKKYTEAKKYIKEALKLGSKDPIILDHAKVINEAR